MKTLTLVVTLVISVASSFSTAQTNGSTPQPLSGSYEFAGPVFDIEATPDGSILIAEGDIIKEISRDGVREIVTILTLEGESPIGTVAVTPLNGLEAIDQESFFATRGGLDNGLGAALWHVSQGNPSLVADIEAFETEHNPDATKGPQWQDLQCEAAQGYTAGPQSNPYQLTALSESEVLIGDAAGNTLLFAGIDGTIDWVAVFTPAVDENGDWLVWTTLEDGTNCYVQPVPTSVAIGPDGAYYVGELSGTTAENILEGQPSPGLSRVWRIEPGARNVVCPSDACAVVIDGLTAIIDVEFGPDGRLHVVEYDQNGWFVATVLENPAGGAIKSCDVNTGDCDTVEVGLVLPGALTFDDWGNLWLLENTFAPTVRRVNP